MSQKEVKVVGVREAGRADLVILLTDRPPVVVPPCPCCIAKGLPGWDWGVEGKATDDTAFAVASILFNDHSPPDWLVGAVCGLLVAQPREGFELPAGDIVRAAEGAVGIKHVNAYLWHRYYVSRAQDEG